MVSVHARIGRRRTTYQVKWRDADEQRQRSASFDTEIDAQEFALAVRRAGGRWPAGWESDELGGSQAQQELTVSKFAQSWAAGLTGISERTRADYLRDLERNVLPVLGHLPVHAVKVADVRHLVQTWERQVSPKTIANRHGTLSGLMQSAVEAGHRLDNPCKGIRLPSVRPTEIVVLTPQEVDLIARQMRRPEDAAIVRFLAGTGLRWGEMAGLDARHVDLLERRLTVAQSLARRGQEQHWTLGPPKTRKAHRTVSLPATVVDELVPLVAGKRSDAAVFTTRYGTRLAYSNWHARVWSPAVADARKLGLEVKPSPHDLRHANASWLLAAGLPILDVSRRLGHESVTTTADRYGHLVPGAHERAAAALDEILGARRPAGDAGDASAGRSRASTQPGGSTAR